MRESSGSRVNKWTEATFLVVVVERSGSRLNRWREATFLVEVVERSGSRLNKWREATFLVVVVTGREQWIKSEKVERSHFSSRSGRVVDQE